MPPCTCSIVSLKDAEPPDPDHPRIVASCTGVHQERRLRHQGPGVGFPSGLRKPSGTTRGTPTAPHPAQAWLPPRVQFRQRRCRHWDTVSTGHTKGQDFFRTLSAPQSGSLCCGRTSLPPLTRGVQGGPPHNDQKTMFFKFGVCPTLRRVLSVVASDTMRSSTTKPPRPLRKQKQTCSNPLPHQASHDRLADVWMPHGNPRPGSSRSLSPPRHTKPRPGDDHHRKPCLNGRSTTQPTDATQMAWGLRWTRKRLWTLHAHWSLGSLNASAPATAFRATSILNWLSAPLRHFCGVSVRDLPPSPGSVAGGDDADSEEWAEP